jgi:hypothetical protein
MSRNIEIFGSLMVLAAAGAADAATLDVCKSGCTYSTIQSAVNAAASGDEIQISSGVYTENVTITGKDLLLEGTGSVLTVVNGGGAAKPVFTLGSTVTGKTPTAYRVTLENLTITGSNQPGVSGQNGGIFVQGDTALTLQSSVVTGNGAGSGGGITINTTTGHGSSIVNSRIEANHGNIGFGCNDVGGGIAINGAPLTISGSTITGNLINGSGAGLWANNSKVTITTSTISNNKASSCGSHLGPAPSQGGGITSVGGSVLTMSDSAIFGNSADYGGGVFVGFSGTTQTGSISKTTIARNTSGAGGYDQDFMPQGAGIWVEADSTPPASPPTLTLVDVYVSHNTDSSLNNVADNVDVPLTGNGNVRIEYTDTSIGDPSNSGCIGPGCGK